MSYCNRRLLIPLEEDGLMVEDIILHGYSKRNKNPGENIENEKFPTASAWYVMLRSRMCSGFYNIVISMYLYGIKRASQPSKFLRLVVSITL